MAQKHFGPGCPSTAVLKRSFVALASFQYAITIDGHILMFVGWEISLHINLESTAYTFHFLMAYESWMIGFDRLHFLSNLFCKILLTIPCSVVSHIMSLQNGGIWIQDRLFITTQTTTKTALFTVSKPNIVISFSCATSEGPQTISFEQVYIFYDGFHSRLSLHYMQRHWNQASNCNGW